MNSAESAASLFGPEDLSSDPFATLGIEHTQEGSDVHFAEVTTDTSAQSTAINVFETLGDQQTLSDGIAGLGHGHSEAQGHGNTPDAHVLTYGANGSRETYEAYGPHTQWNDQHYYSANTASNNSYDTRQYASPPTTHDPYAPTSTPTYVPVSQQSSVSQQPTTAYPVTQQPAYNVHPVSNPYTPPQASAQPSYGSYNAYAPNPTQTSASAYDPPYSIPQTSSYPAAPPVIKASLAAVPPPPAPTSTQITRPKLLNAYDPPFPTTSYSRRNVSGPARMGAGHSTPAQAAYAAYQSATPPPPPLPPPPPRVPVVPSTYTPSQPVPPTYTPPQPATRTPEYAPAYVPSAPAPSQHAPQLWGNKTDATLIGSEHHTMNSYASNIQPSQPSAPYTPPPDAASQPQWTPPHLDATQLETDNVALEGTPSQAESGAGFFDEFAQQANRVDLDSPANDLPINGHPPLVPIIPSPSAQTSPEIKHASTYSPNAPLTSSPQKSKPLSPPPGRMGQDVPHVSSPQRSPRPLSTASPVHSLSHAPRISPDLYSNPYIGGERIPRARTASPGINSNTSLGLHMYPSGNAGRPKSASLASIDNTSLPGSPPDAIYDRYAPRGGARVPNVHGVERTVSPGPYSTRSSDNHQSTKPLHLPPVLESPYLPSSSSQEPTSVPEDPYVPQRVRSQIKPSQSFGAYEPTTSLGYGADLSVSQEAIFKPSVNVYAPSPSLVGANDPLGRTSVRVPVISFGFGGRLVTCFHNEGILNTGFDVALASRTSTKIILQNWKRLVPESALDSASTFPGPLHADPGPPSTGIIKTTATSQAKTKKAQLVKYLTDRAEEITQGLGYLHSGSMEKRTAEGKLALVKLLKILVENDGCLLGTPQLDSAVRLALVPRLDGLLSASASDASTFTTTADTGGILPESLSFGSIAAAAGDTPISVTTLRAAALDKIEEFLLRGERRQAYHYALDEKLWGHAMVIASSIDKEAWKDVVNEFLRTELGAKGDSGFTIPGRNDTRVPTSNGRESLRVAYSLFSGQGAAAVQELVPRNILTRPNGRLPISATVPSITAPTPGQPTPRTPNFAVPTTGAKIPVESLSKWAELVATMISSPLTNDTSAALTALGDQLVTNGWLEAAHVCYLLSPQTSPLGGVGNPTARVVLLGSKSPSALLTFSKEPDFIIFTEILEYALANAPVTKGQEPNHGIPHLQAYRLIRAFAAAEAGDVQIASRYCEAITACLARGSPYFTPTMLEQLRGLADRLAGNSHSDKSNSWMAGKISKPSLDTIGGWLDRRFTKLVTGESDSPSSPKEESGKSEPQAFAGPFAHYSTISSTTSSARSSPQPTFITPAYALPQRTGSAMSNKAPYGLQADRTSSAKEPMHRKPSPGFTPQTLSTTTSATSFSTLQTQMGSSHDSYSNGYSPSSDLQTPKPSQTHDHDAEEDSVQEVTWWGSSGYGDTGKTPTAAHFESVEDTSGILNSDGYFSPMSHQTFGPRAQSSASPRQDHEEDDDDLGLGNNTNRKEEQTEDDRESKGTAAEAAKKPDPKPLQSGATSGSWFSRWWKKGDNPPGPVKASLGETSSFYYDKELKRWVNKKAGDETAKPAPLPPPPRAQTASPAMTGPKPPGPNANGTANGIGPRPASAIDLSSSPPANKPVMRVRSNLAPPGLDSAPPTPTGTRMTQSGPPPPSRPKSQASQKRNLRSRYVDVFAQESGNGGA